MTHPILFWLAIAVAVFCAVLGYVALLSPQGGNEHVARSFHAAMWVFIAAAAALALG
jgi:hypothetical protein